MRRFLLPTTILLIIVSLTLFFGAQRASAEAGAGLLLNQTETSGGLNAGYGRVGQVFRPTNTGIVDTITMVLNTSGSGCVDGKVRLYEWIGSQTDNPNVGRGPLIAESDIRQICSNTGYPVPVNFVWNFSGDNEVLVSDTAYYYLEFGFTGIGATPTMFWYGHSNPALIDGEAWAEYQGVWGSPPSYSSVEDLYLVISGIPNGKIAIASPANGDILSDRNAVLNITYVEPDNDSFDIVKLEFFDFYTKALLQEETFLLSSDEKVAGYHLVAIPAFITESGNYFEVTAGLQDCAVSPCVDGAVSSKKYFSVPHEPTQSEFILNQSNLENSSEVQSKFNLVGQVFKPENSGFIHTATMKLGTSGNHCAGFHARLYEWLGDRESSPENSRGTLLAEADQTNICSNTAYPTRKDFTWNFTGENQILLSNNSYYYLELDYDGRTYLASWQVPDVHWYGSPNGSLIDGRIWAYQSTWQSPQANSGALDLYLIIGGEITPGLTPVVIVPGIMGSRLNRVSDGEEVWPRSDLMPFSEDDGYLNGLILDSSGEQIPGLEVNPLALIDREEVNLGNTTVERVAYGNLVNRLIELGYESGTTLVTVPYDWRLDINDELDRLDSAVQSAIGNSPSGKINIIAHSMGGLLVKEYLNNLSDTSFVDKLIVAGVPQLGAPKALKAIVYGDNMDFNYGPIDFLNPERIRIISQNMPGVYELLPSERYVQLVGGFVHDFRNNSNQTLNYEETKQFMKDNDENSTLVERADVFHQLIDASPFNATDVYNIMGCKKGETIGGFRLYNDKVEITLVDGDGTVPLFSAINISSGYTNYFVPKNSHMDIIREDKPLELINNILSGSPEIVPDGVETTNQKCFNQTNQDKVIDTIYISTHSPVELHVYDLDGNHVGPNADGDIDLEIPDSDYEIIGHNNFAILPDGEYQIVVDATDSGEFDLEIEIYADLVPQSKITYIDVPVESGDTVASVNFMGSTGDLTLDIDNDGDNIPDEQIQPNAILDQDTASDITPPEISFNMQDEVTVNSQVIMDFTVTDDLSGVEIVEANLDGAQVGMGDSVLVPAIGEHTLIVRAVDKAGNPRMSEFVFNAVDAVIDLDDSDIYTTSTSNSVTTTWTTTHPATSRVIYDTVSHNPVIDPEPNYGYANSTVEVTTLVTNHSVTVNGLLPSTTYFFRPVSHGSPEIYGDEVSVTTTALQESGDGGGGSSGSVPETSSSEKVESDTPIPTAQDQFQENSIPAVKTLEEGSTVDDSNKDAEGDSATAFVKPTSINFTAMVLGLAWTNYLSSPLLIVLTVLAIFGLATVARKEKLFEIIRKLRGRK